MSLINQALKKAKQERSNDPLSTVPVEKRSVNYTATQPGNPASNTSFIIFKYVVGGLLLTAGLGAAITFMITIIRKPESVNAEPASEFAIQIKSSVNTNEHQRENKSPNSNPSLVSPSPKTQSTNMPLLSTSTTQQTALEIKQPESPLKATPTNELSATNKQKNPNRLIETPGKQPVFLETNIPQNTEPETNFKPPKPNENIIAFLEESQIAGVRTAGNKSKVLMNNQVFQINSIIDKKTNLKIIKILNNEIQFIDESGIRYRKQF